MVKKKQTHIVIEELQLHNLPKEDRELAISLYDTFLKDLKSDYPERTLRGNYVGMYELGMSNFPGSAALEQALKVCINKPEDEDQQLMAKAIFVASGYKELFS